VSARYSPSISLASGAVSDEPPRKRRPTKYDWDGARVLLEANPGLWVEVFDRFTSGMYTFLRQGGPAVLREMGGDLQLSLRNQELIEKTKYGTLYLRWTPEGWTEQDQARAEAALAAGEGQL
jgi:hypothetical protein